jgi:hypothetical protein
MSPPKRFPRKLMIRVDDAFFAVVDAALRPGETRSTLIRDAAVAEAERRQTQERSEHG